MTKKPKVRILFVCMGNICRSPTAHGVFRRKAEEAGLVDVIHIESAGTHAYHVGEAPDSRSQEAATRRVRGGTDAVLALGELFWLGVTGVFSSLAGAQDQEEEAR